MTRHSLASAVLLLTSLGMGVAMNGCSDGPGETRGEASVASSTSEALGTLACPYPFTVAKEEKACRPIGGTMTCSNEMECVPVTDVPASPPSINLTTTPIPAASALAGLGCTEGVQITDRQNSNIWACPSFVSDRIPTNLGAEPTCPPPGSPPITAWPDGGLDCETVYVAATITPNSVVGNPIAGWVLVQELVTPLWTNGSGGSCSGGCPVVGGGGSGPIGGSNLE